MAALCLMALALGGCAALQQQFGGGPPQPSATAAVAATPRDPVLAFVAGADVGTSGRVAAAPGAAPVVAEVLNSYHAASGRMCRSFRVAGSGPGATRVACRAGDTWVEARPLLPGRQTP